MASKLSLHYKRTPVTELSHSVFEKAGVTLLVKREDLNSPTAPGNKWWKLKYNLEEAFSKSQSTVLTFGGAYSNHIYAVAGACAEAGLKSIGIIRGELTTPLNPTLEYAAGKGMALHYISREKYRMKKESDFLADLRDRFGDFYLIPEGGSNDLGVKGCVDFAREELSEIQFDHVVVPVGTGATMAGIVCGLDPTRTVIGVSVLKNAHDLRHSIASMIKISGKDGARWELWEQYHYGGFAKATKELEELMLIMHKDHDLPLEHVYTAKALSAIMNESRNGAFKRGSTVLMVHTGGLQNRPLFKRP